MNNSNLIQNVGLGCVVKGFDLKTTLQTHLENEGYTTLDFGCFTPDSFVSYTEVGSTVAQALNKGQIDLGIICCNFGCSACTGVSKYKGVIAMACESTRSAEMCRKVNGANVLCMGQSMVTPELGCQIADTFLRSNFLDMEGVPDSVQEFRRQAHQEVIAAGRPVECIIGKK